MKDRSNSPVPSQVGQHPGVLPACKVQHRCPDAGTGSSFLSAVWVQAMARGRHPASCTRPAVSPALVIPDTLWGASQVCLETTRLVQYASVQSFCTRREARGSTPFTIHPGTLISISSCLHSLPQWQPGVLPKTCGGIQRAGKCA